MKTVSAGLKMSTTGNAAATAHHMRYSKRAAEKRDVQNLNQRLEYYVGINKRQHKDYLRMKESLLAAENNFNLRMTAKDTEITTTNDKFTSERGALTEELGASTAAADSAQTEAEGLAAKYAQLTDTYVATDGKVQADEAALGRLVTELKETRACYDKARRDLNSRQTQSASLTVKLNEVNRDIDGLTSVTASLTSQLEVTRCTMKEQRNKRTTQISELQAAIGERIE